MDDSESTVQTRFTCRACGYDLRGAAIDDDCPECGRPVAGLAISGASLTRREAVAVGLRLAALMVVVNSIYLFDALFSLIEPLFFSTPMGWPLHARFLLYQFGPLALRVALAAWLWWQAPRLARRIVLSDGPVFGRDSLAAEALLSVGLMLLGAYLALTAGAALVVPAVLGFLQVVPEPGFVPPMTLGVMAPLAVKLVVGVVLVMCRPLHRWLGGRVAASV